MRQDSRDERTKEDAIDLFEHYGVLIKNARFASAGDLLSYAQLISGGGESAGKLKRAMGLKIGRKIGNAGGAAESTVLR